MRRRKLLKNNCGPFFRLPAPARPQGAGEGAVKRAVSCRAVIKNTLFALLALLVLGAGGLAAVSLRPSGGGVLAGAAFAGSLLASPRTAMAAMGRLWADEHPAGQGPAAGQGLVKRTIRMDY